MTKTFSYSAENNEFLDMTQNNYFFEGEDAKVLHFCGDKNDFLEFVNCCDSENIKFNFNDSENIKFNFD
jgi:hypothetical protein